MGYLIDDAYNTLKTLFQKHNRGFLSPDEFNNVARYVQAKIIRESFNYINIIKSKKKIGRVSKNDFDKEKYYKEVVRRLRKRSLLTYSDPYFTYPTDYSFTEEIFYDGVKVEEIGMQERVILTQPEVYPSELYPLYFDTADGAEILPDTIDSLVTLYYYRDPVEPNWTHQSKIFDAEDALFQDFELPEAVFDVIIMEMAQYLGIELKQPDIVQVFTRDIAESEQLKNRD